MLRRTIVAAQLSTILADDLALRTDVRIKVYGGHGTATSWHGKTDKGQYTIDALEQLGISAELVTEDYIRSDNFSRASADIVWFPGGGAHAYGNVVGDDGIQRIQDFVADGGSYVGVCAGAYFATTCTSSSGEHGQGPPCAGPPDQSGPGAKGPLNFINADTKEPYDRGDGYVSFDINAEGQAALGVQLSSLSNVTYADGPMFIPLDSTSLPPYKVLATFTSEVNEVDPEKTTGQMLGSPAIVTTSHGKGIVLVSPVHLELSLGDGSLDTANLLAVLAGFVRIATPSDTETLSV